MNRADRSAIHAGVIVLVFALLPLAAGSCSLGTSQTTGGASSSTTAPSDSTTVPSPATATAAGVTMEYPGDWYSRVDGDSGLTLAERREDLTSERPAGARLVLDSVGAASTDMVSVLSEVAPSGTDLAVAAGSLVVVEDAAKIQVGTEQAVSIALRDENRGQQTVSRYVVVELDGGTCFVFRLEAPANRWESKAAALDRILQSARFPTPGS